VLPLEEELEELELEELELEDELDELVVDPVQLPTEGLLPVMLSESIFARPALLVACSLTMLVPL